MNVSIELTGAQVPLEAAQEAMSHFRDIFEVRSASGTIAKMNEIYVQLAEVDQGNHILFLEITQYRTSRAAASTWDQ